MTIARGRANFAPRLAVQLDLRDLRWDGVPIVAALVGAALERALQNGVELGLLTLLATSILSPVLRRALGVELSHAHQVLAAAFTVCGLLPAVIYPIPLAAPLVLFFASAVTSAASVAAEAPCPLRPRDGLALTVILVMNFALRRAELLTVNTLVPYVDIRAALDRGLLSLLLPLDIGHGAKRWSTSGLVIVAAIESVIGSHATLQLLNLCLIVAAAAVSWFAFGSRAFSLTLALCVALGTQFHYTYVNSSCLILYLFTGYVLVNLLCLWKVATGAAPQRRWRTSFAISLVVVALCWEMWLDYAAFLIAGLILASLDRRPEVRDSRRPIIRFVGGCLAAILVVYLPCKLLLGGSAEHTRRGQEAEVFITYFHSLAPGEAATIAAEDVLVNALTYNHVALTNYLPPSLVASPSLDDLGEARILEEHAGYGVPSRPELAPSLVSGNYLFMWRFLAGATSLVLYYAVVIRVRAWLREPSAMNGVFVALLLMIVFGASTHLLIKFRFYNAVPLLAYKCILAVTGVTLLVSFLVMRMQEVMSPERFRISLLAVWLTIAYGALARPPFLGRMGEMVACGSMPDPLANGGELLSRSVRR